MSGPITEGAEQCIFCDIIMGRSSAEIVRRWDDAMAIVPLNPVTVGHTLVIPYQCARDYTVDPEASATAMRRAAEIAPVPSNLITSAGREATQSVWHLHLHIVPRAENDGLALPWYSGSCRTLDGGPARIPRGRAGESS